jgi:hypothetical protein
MEKDRRSLIMSFRWRLSGFPSRYFLSYLTLDLLYLRVPHPNDTTYKATVRTQLTALDNTIKKVLLLKPLPSLPPVPSQACIVAMATPIPESLIPGCPAWSLRPLDLKRAHNLTPPVTPLRWPSFGPSSSRWSECRAHPGHRHSVGIRKHGKLLRLVGASLNACQD